MSILTNTADKCQQKSRALRLSARLFLSSFQLADILEIDRYFAAGGTYGDVWLADASAEKFGGICGKDDAIAATFDLNVAAFFHLSAAAQTLSHRVHLLIFLGNVYPSIWAR